MSQELFNDASFFLTDPLDESFRDDTEHTSAADPNSPLNQATILDESPVTQCGRSSDEVEADDSVARVLTFN